MQFPAAAVAAVAVGSNSCDGSQARRLHGGGFNSLQTASAEGCMCESVSVLLSVTQRFVSRSVTVFNTGKKSEFRTMFPVVVRVK